MREVPKAEGEKKPKICTIYRKIVQIASFSLPHPSGAPSSEGAASLQAPTIDYRFYNIESSYTGRTGTSAATEAICQQSDKLKYAG